MNQEINNLTPGVMTTVNPEPTFGQCVEKYFRNSLDFDGRARRSEYWKIVLFNLITLGFLYPITIISGLSLAVRRLHDTGKSGWYLLISLIPLVGGILLLVAMCSDSDRGQNQYGSSPKYQPLPEKPEGTPSTPFFQAWIDSMKNIFNFKGRARTSEFWKPFVMNAFVWEFFYVVHQNFRVFNYTYHYDDQCDYYGKVIIDSFNYNSIGVFFFIVFIIISIGWAISTISMLIRRLHDIGKKGKAALVWNSIMIANTISIIPLMQYVDIINYSTEDHPGYYFWNNYAMTSAMVAILYGIFFCGQIYQLYKDSQPGTNEWGPSSKYPEEA